MEEDRIWWCKMKNGLCAIRSCKSEYAHCCLGGLVISYAGLSSCIYPCAIGENDMDEGRLYETCDWLVVNIAGWGQSQVNVCKEVMMGARAYLIKGRYEVD